MDLYRTKRKVSQNFRGLDLSTAGTWDDLRKRLSKFFKAESSTLSRPTSLETPVSTPVDTNLSLCEKVRNWEVNYDGVTDGTSFLERIREFQECYNLEGKDLLKTLPLLLRGNALLWYRNSKDT